MFFCYINKNIYKLKNIENKNLLMDFIIFKKFQIMNFYVIKYFIHFLISNFHSLFFQMKFIIIKLFDINYSNVIFLIIILL